MCVFITSSRKQFLSDHTDRCMLLTGGHKIEFVTKYSHLSHVVKSYGVTVDIINLHFKLINQINKIKLITYHVSLC
jgi:hypothetical protein